ncbi:hypothetical protein FRACYDRAFT_245776 [Fragilariopsis cylindrus CCMP1102]|uniref:Uncharacterized protein n=1 Tax=Fragilariopsis cylindrus CCMP1102 TaxID=635003 RepID=A0A1E7EZX2_9STRA|nr:hypothetical protein FRACYDRAFT_245776 [Fragilariopsis cylindrus CCMP1102]|eukprot:OEU11364.1 hypothetical protein FRACYDRAFT_245776 [Fragilariopsis cylindrus CCMP1102]
MASSITREGNGQRGGHGKTTRSYVETFNEASTDESVSNNKKRRRRRRITIDYYDSSRRCVIINNEKRDSICKGPYIDDEYHECEYDHGHDHDDDDNNKKEVTLLPTTIELSEELCKVVDRVHYSRDESLEALDTLFEWAYTRDTIFLTNFYKYGGVIRIVDFLKTTIIMEDVVVGGGGAAMTSRLECIEIVVRVIAQVTYAGETNHEIATKIATAVVDCDGIQILLQAAGNNKYTSTGGGSSSGSSNDVKIKLEILREIGSIFNNITHHCGELLGQELALAILDLGMNNITGLNKVVVDDHPIAFDIVRALFDTFSNIVLLNNNDYVTKKYFKDKNILSKCLEVFYENEKNNNIVSWIGSGRRHSCRENEEKLMKSATRLFAVCGRKKLLDECGSDYENLLPVCVMSLKEYPTNEQIRKNVLKLLNGALCCTDDNNEVHVHDDHDQRGTIEKAGTIEALSSLLTTKGINEDEKTKIRKVISKIIAPP